MTDPTKELEGEQPFKELADLAPGTPVAPAHGVAAIALHMAMKYYDISTVQDGALYQQYKLEGKNLAPLHLDMVLETAVKLEAHLLGASQRIAKLIVDAIEFHVEDDKNEAGGVSKDPGTAETSTTRE